MMIDEQQIINRVLHGEKDQFSELLSIYGDKVLSFVVSVVSNPIDAEDIVEEVFVNAYIHLEQFDANRASFFTWLRSIAWHEIIKYRRRHSHQISLSHENDSNDGDNDDRLDLMLECINELNAEQQMLIKLYYYDEMSLKEIAVILDSKAENLANKLMRLRKKLQTMIIKKEKYNN